MLFFMNGARRDAPNYIESAESRQHDSNRPQRTKQGLGFASVELRSTNATTRPAEKHWSTNYIQHSVYRTGREGSFHIIKEHAPTLKYETGNDRGGGRFRDSAWASKWFRCSVNWIAADKSGIVKTESFVEHGTYSGWKRPKNSPKRKAPMFGPVFRNIPPAIGNTFCRDA